MGKSEFESKRMVELEDEFRQFRSFNNEFKSESDRAAVVLGAALLDSLLHQLIDAYLLPKPKQNKEDELLEGSSPLATFSARIKMCYRLGLIDKEFLKALDLIRKIRNNFAHEISGVSLEIGPESQRAKTLVKLFWDNKNFRNIHQKFYEGVESNGVKFRTVVGFMSIRLHGAIDKTNRVTDYEAKALLPVKNE